MSDQNGAPIETTAVAEPAAAPEPVKAPTLDAVFDKYDIQAAAPPSEPQAPQAPAPSPAPTSVPPVQPTAHNPYGDFVGTYGGQDPDAAWQAQLEALNTRFSALEQRELQAQQQAHIDAQNRAGVAAVNKVMEVIGDGADEVLVKGELSVLLAENDRFRAAFEQRDANPEAWDAALTAIGENRRQRLSIEVDPQTAEDQRATSAAFSTSESGPPHVNTHGSAATTMSDRDFDNHWRSFQR